MCENWASAIKSSICNLAARYCECPRKGAQYVVVLTLDKAQDWAHHHSPAPRKSALPEPPSIRFPEHAVGLSTARVGLGFDAG
jgi:hypothetical protein